MSECSRMVSLGFTPQPVPAGVHICQIFSDDQERLDALLGFVRSGLEAGERVACITEKFDESVLSAELNAQGMSLQQLKANGAFALSGTKDVYFLDNRFDPDRTLALLKSINDESVAAGCPAARVIGELTAEIQHVSGGTGLLEYEARVTMLQRTCPVTAVCQYDAHAFDGATLMQVLKVHPLMVVRGAVVHNPYYVPPEDYLAQRS